MSDLETNDLVDTHDLVERARSGDGAAFAALYDLFAPRLYRFFRFRAATAEAAEDLTQRVFLKMIEQLHSYEQRGIPFAAWVFRVARNTWIDDDRTNHPSVPLDSLVEREAQTDGPDVLAAASIEFAQVRTAIAALPTAQREVLECRFFAGLTTGETAAQLGRSEGSIRVIQHRALAELRRRLPTIERALEIQAEGSPR